MTTDEVHFVYLSDLLPPYAESSLFLAKKYSGLKVHLLGNKSQENQIKKLDISFTAIEDFYNSSEFNSTSKKITSSETFRDGFWLKTLERFFVIEQFMKNKNIFQVFHAELDQILFSANELVENLQNSGKSGIFLPFHNQQKAIASVVYCNNVESLSSLIKFAKRAKPFESEMELLASWAQENSQYAFQIPTIANVSDPKANFGISNKLTLSTSGGIVDAAQLGQWVAGIDPRNVPIPNIPKTKFSDPAEPGVISLESLEKLVFTFDSNENHLIVNDQNGNSYKVFNLHIHSKVHNWINKVGVNKFLSIVNHQKPKVIKSALIEQIKNAINLNLFKSAFNLDKLESLFLRVLYSKLKLRPKSNPFMSGDSFRALAKHIWEKNNKKIDLGLVKDGDIVFCESDLLEEFELNILKNLNAQVVLLLGNSDRNFTNESFHNISIDKLTKVFVQNLLEPIPGVGILPIGLENRWRATHGKIIKFRFLRMLLPEKKMRIMWTFSVGTNLAQRSAAASALHKTHVASHLNSLTPSKHRKSLAKFGFVASPPGNGEDTHRTWEAMYLKTVPIVLRSALTEKCWELGLPIWIVDSYDELINVTQSELVGKYNLIKARFDSPTLWMNYWEDAIRS